MAQQAANNAAQANINAVNAAAVPLPGAVVQAAIVQFAAWPGLANTRVLDYNLSSDLKFFNKATESLSTKFDLKSGNIKVFLECVKERARIYNWKEVLEIPDESVPPIGINLIKAYGRITLAQCRAESLTYLGGNGGRKAQDSNMLYQFLSNSLTEEAKNVVQADESVYILIINGEEYPSGTCLLKTIIGKSTVDTAATVHVLRESVATLASKMVELGSNITAFNLHVTQVHNALLARGEAVPELLYNLFKAYKMCSDSTFATYIEMKQYSFNEGTPMTVDLLMTIALNHYELKIENGTWSAMDQKDSKIFALTARLDELSKKPAPKQKAPKQQSNNDRYAWKLVPPKAGEKLTKTVSKKTYHWCPKHVAWTIHTAPECKLLEQQPQEDSSSPKSLSMSKAYRAIVDEDDDASVDDA
jgi:hypothetical protein